MENNASVKVPIIQEVKFSKSLNKNAYNAKT